MSHQDSEDRVAMSLKGTFIMVSFAVIPILGSTKVIESGQPIEQRSRDASSEFAKRVTIPLEQQPLPKVIPKEPDSPETAKDRRKLNERMKRRATEDKSNQSHQSSGGIKPSIHTEPAIHKQETITPADPTCAVLDGPKRTDLAIDSPEAFEKLVNKCKR